MLTVNERLNQKIHNNTLNQNYSKDLEKIVSEIVSYSNLSINTALIFYNRNNERLQLSEIIDKNTYCIYVNDKNCLKCLIDASTLNSEIIFIICYSDEKWFRWISSGMLKDKEVFRIQENLIDNVSEAYPLLLRFENINTLNFLFPITSENMKFLNYLL